LNQTQAAASSSLAMEEEAEDENMESEDLAQDAFDPSAMQGGDPLGLAPSQAGVSISYILSQPSQPAGPGQAFQLKEETGVEREERGAGRGEDTMREWFMSRSGEDDIIRKYLHKKFTKSRREYVTEVVSDRGILRKSVIVPNIGYRPGNKKEEGKETAEEGSSGLSQNFDLMRNLNAKASESIEENRLQVIKSNFEQSWRSIDFGEEMVNHFILYCQHKQELPLSHWMIANKHFRERYLKFICGLELTERIPSGTLFKMLQRNLGKAQMMTYIFSFNLPCTEAIDFAYGANDLMQWQARDPAIPGVEFAVMLQNLSLPLTIKMEFINFLRDKLRPILADKTVFILLILLIVIEDEDEEHEVNTIRNIVMSLMIGHIQRTSVNDLTFDLEIIKNCVDSLPALCNLFQSP